MKKTIAKITAALSAAVMCALPMANALTSSAATTPVKTFRTYIDIDATDYDLHEFEYDRRFGGSYKNTTTFRGYKVFLAGDIDHTTPQTGRSCLFIESDGLRRFQGTVATETYDCTYADANVNGFKNSITKVIWAFNDWKNAGHTDYYDDFEDKVTEEIVLVGDTNRNGTIELSDAVYILQYVANPIKYSGIDKKAADVDGNGYVNSYDALLIQRYQSGLINSFGDVQA